MTNDKQVIINLGNVRVIRLDTLNMAVEVLREFPAEVFKNPKTGEEIHKPEREEWRQTGFFSNTKMALKHIYDNDLLMEEKERTLEEYLTVQKEILRELKRFGI